MNEIDCIVVGAGASGLVAASRLARAGKQVLVLEGNDRLGGCIHSWRPEKDYWLELGAHTAYNSYGPLLEALDERGRLGELLGREKLGYLFCLPDGRLQSPVGRLNFLEAALTLPFGLTRPKAGRTVAEWFGGLLGKRNYRRLLAPAFAAVLSQPADSFPAEWLFRRKPRMQAAPRKFTFPGGLQGLIEALAQNAPFQVKTGTPVRSIRRSGQGFAVAWGDEESSRSPGRPKNGLAPSGGGSDDFSEPGAQLTCGQLVLATPVDTAAALLADAYPEVARDLQSFPMSSSEAMGVVLPATETRMKRVAGLIGADDDFWSVVTRDPVPHAAYRGFTFHFRPGRLSRHEKLERIATVLGVPMNGFLHVAEMTNRLPAPGVEHPRRVQEVDAQLAGEPLALVGNYLNGLSIGDCAERAARETDRLLAL